MKFTQARIDNLACPAGKRDMLIFDDEQRGLGVRVTNGGSKSYLAQYTAHGQKRRVPLGSCKALSLAKAREAARVIAGDVAKGKDPAHERRAAAIETRRKAAHDSLTLEKLIDDWRALHLVNRRARYAQYAERSLRRAFAAHLQLPAAELDRALIVRAIDQLTRAGTVAMAAQTQILGKALYGWAVRRGMLERDPFANLPRASLTARERVLTDEELAAIWRATADGGTHDNIVRLLFLTGQRRGEVAGMVWGELSDDLATWTLPPTRTKNGRAHIVPLSQPAREILQSLPRVNDLVFPGLHGAFNGFTSGKRRLDQESGVGDWRLHDLRRTLATGLQRLGVRLEVTESVLNHVGGSRSGIVGVYQRHAWADEKRAALEAWAAHVMAIVEGRAPADNVVAMTRKS
jgi:integrase